MTSQTSLDESTRPRAPRHPDAKLTAVGRANAQALVQLHNHLRADLDRIRKVVAEVAAGQSDPAAARSLINRMTMRQNYWSVGAFCASYCRVLAVHHTIEDEHMFADLAAADTGLRPVLDRLSEEHEVIAGVLAGLDDALVEMISDPARLSAVREQVDDLTEILLSHLDYEERELLEPIARLSIQI